MIKRDSKERIDKGFDPLEVHVIVRGIIAGVKIDQLMCDRWKDRAERKEHRRSSMAERGICRACRG